MGFFSKKLLNEKLNKGLFFEYSKKFIKKIKISKKMFEKYLNRIFIKFNLEKLSKSLIKNYAAI